MPLKLVENISKRRDKLVIMAEILDLTKKGLTKTQILFEANLSSSQLNNYLAILSGAGLIECSSLNGKEIYKATKKGIELMEKQYQIINLINESNKTDVKSLSLKIKIRKSSVLLSPYFVVSCLIISFFNLV
jgi:predicted transcriptional regulator